MTPEETDPGADLSALQAELRQALQHRRAALERVRETQAELEALIERARRALERPGSGSDSGDAGAG